MFLFRYLFPAFGTYFVWSSVKISSSLIIIFVIMFRSTVDLILLDFQNEYTNNLIECWVWFWILCFTSSCFSLFFSFSLLCRYYLAVQKWNVFKQKLFKVDIALICTEFCISCRSITVDNQMDERLDFRWFKKIWGVAVY